MQARIIIDDGRDALLTTDHATSSHGQPVLVLEGLAYGPGDQVPAMHNRMARHIVDSSCTQWEQDNPTTEELPGVGDPTDEETRTYRLLRDRYLG